MLHPHRLLHLSRALFLSLLLCHFAGCAMLEQFSAIKKPTARIAGVDIGGISMDAATLAFKVEVQNPYSVPLPLTNLDYNLATGGTSFLSGKSQIQGLVPALGKKTISLPITVRYLETLRLLKGVRPGSILRYESELGLSVDPGVGAPLRLPMKAAGDLPIPAAPQVSLTDIQWSQLNLSQVAGTANLRLVNPNQFSLDLSKVNFALALGGSPVAKGSLLREVALRSNGGAGTIQIPVSLSPAEVGASLLGLLGGKKSTYKISGAMEASTPFGPLSLPLEKVGETLFRR